MSENTERDTHFAGTARLFLHEIIHAIDELSTEGNDIVDGCAMCNWDEAKVIECLSPLIARHIFDLAYHTLWNTTQAMAAYCEHRPNVKEELLSIPDLTEWPEIY